MATLETLEHLAVWTGKDPVIVAADPFAQMVLERATEMVIEKAGIPATWETDPTLVPSRAKTICLLLAARTYTNRRSVISQGVGPISESILAQMAAAMQLTEAEAEELQDMANDNAGAFGGLWVLPTTRGDDYPIQDTVILQDSTGSDWGIPYAVEGETGAFDVLDTTGGTIDPDAFALLQAQVSTLMGSVAGLDTEKADQTTVDAALATKADASTVGALEDTLALKANQSDVDAALLLKATQAAMDSLTTIVNSKADQSTIDAALALKANLEDLGVQIRLTQPESGSGELWADTSGA